MEMVEKWRSNLLDRVPPKLRHQQAMRVLNPAVDTELYLLDVLVTPGTTAIDVGAHRGLFSVAMREAGANVIAFEPNRELAIYLQKLLGSSATVVPAGVSDDAGEAEFFVPVMGAIEVSTRGSLLQNDEPGLRDTRSLRVLKVRLDDLNLHDVSAIKVDVEGHEMEAIRGMTGTLERERPNLIIESEQRHNDSNPAQLIRHLINLGYAGYFRHEGSLNPVEQFDVSKHQDPQNSGTADYVMNFLFVPIETEHDLLPALRSKVADLFTNTEDS